ncbi:MAG: NapC/NirT family cytochrome c [Planctomycetes bacterium]|nr:NapC/NirT family cytochrome c [Planctomycetota bacterium]
MNAPRSGGTLRRIHLLIRSNWISSLGAALMTIAVLAFATAWVAHAFGKFQGPYVGILVLIVLPAVFVLGLICVPAGLFLYRKQLNARVEALADRPLYLARAVAVITLINFAALGTAGYGGSAYMNSTQFCGMACHTAMEPEFVSYQRSPHKRVDCVHCHIGPGTESFVKAKLNGLSQLYHFVRDDWHRPIPTPVENLRPADEICGECHDPEKYLGTQLLVRPRYREDDDVTPYVNVLLMRRGGTRPDGKSVGIHWHVHPDARVEYIATDERREHIPWMRVTYADGSERVFAADGVAHDDPPEGELRRMDCNDCHNRIGHEFERPEDAVDEAIAVGLISRRLPAIKRLALEALRTEWTRDGAADGIRQQLQSHYASNGSLDESTRQLLEGATEQIAAIWQRNVYPERKVGWNAYPALDTHFGCFRCHDDQHRDRAGRVVPQTCDNCHVVLSEEEENPAILDALGLRRR